MTKMLTRTGQVVDLLDPSPHTIKLTDIALHLSRIPRFNGATLRTWSVADHSLLVADLMGAEADPDLALAALLHDAHEAFIGDVIQPLKSALGEDRPRVTGEGWHSGAADLRIIAQRLDGVIARAFGLDPELLHHDAVKDADRLAFAVEATRLMPPGISVDPLRSEDIPPLPVRDQMAAQNHFLIRALELIAARHGARVAITVPAEEPIPEPTTAPEAAAPTGPAEGDHPV